MRKVAVLQSSYLPWRGYFHLIQQADAFVFLDSVQYTRCDWRNRNKIITSEGLHWLSVPVHGSRNLSINQVQIDNSIAWQKKHFLTICQYYKRAACFAEMVPWLQDIYLDNNWVSLSELNQSLIIRIAGYLGYQTSFYNDNVFIVDDDKNQRLIDIVKAVKGTTYLTGPSALTYLDIEQFRSQGIEIEVMQYPAYPKYQQLWNCSEEKVSILDLLLHKGTDSPFYISGQLSY